MQPNPLRYKGHPLEWFLFPENLSWRFCLQQGRFPLNPHRFNLHPEHRSLVESSVGNQEEKIFLSGTQKTPEGTLEVRFKLADNSCQGCFWISFFILFNWMMIIYQWINEGELIHVWYCEWVLPNKWNLFCVCPCCQGFRGRRRSRWMRWKLSLRNRGVQAVSSGFYTLKWALPYFKLSSRLFMPAVNTPNKTKSKSSSPEGGGVTVAPQKIAMCIKSQSKVARGLSASS